MRSKPLRSGVTLGMNSSFLSALRQLMSFPKARGCPVGPSFGAASVEAVHWNGPLLTGPCPLPPISGGHVFAPLPSVSSFTSLEACMCSFQPGRFTSATLLAGRDPDGEQVACVFVSSGPSTVPDTPVSGECSNKDCQCECQRRRRRAWRGRCSPQFRALHQPGAGGSTLA